MNPNTFRLTDELERQLMLQAMEDQFRPRPMRALAAGLRKLADGIKSVAGKSSSKAAHSAA